MNPYLLGSVCIVGILVFWSSGVFSKEIDSANAPVPVRAVKEEPPTPNSESEIVVAGSNANPSQCIRTSFLNSAYSFSFEGKTVKLFHKGSSKPVSSIVLSSPVLDCHKETDLQQISISPYFFIPEDFDASLRSIPNLKLKLKFKNAKLKIITAPEKELIKEFSKFPFKQPLLYSSTTDFLLTLFILEQHKQEIEQAVQTWKQQKNEAN